jgi:hypothetical protein
MRLHGSTFAISVEAPLGLVDGAELEVLEPVDTPEVSVSGFAFPFSPLQPASTRASPIPRTPIAERDTRFAVTEFVIRSC